MDGAVGRENFYNLLSIMDAQNFQLQQINEQLINMNRGMANLTNPVSVTPTRCNSSRTDNSDTNSFTTVKGANIMISQSNPTSLLTHNLSSNMLPLMPNNPFLGSNTGYNSFIPVRNSNNPNDYNSEGFVLKLKDVLMLKLSELQGVGIDSRLARFYGQVEFCVSTDVDRIQVALSRVEQEIATLLTAEIGKMESNISWSEFKDILNHHFACSTNVTQAWQEIEIEHYSIDEAPRAFVSRIQCKLSAFEMKYPKNSLPKTDIVVKKKLYRGLSNTAQDRLKDFLDDRIPLERFIDFVEYEHHLAVIGKMGCNISWNEFKDIMNHHFASSANIIQAWQDIEIEHYSIDEAPRAFVSRIKCKLSAIEMKFPKDSLPKADSLVKKKLYRGLSNAAQDRLKDFLDDSISLERFIEFVEYEHHLAKVSGDLTQCKVLSVNNSNSQPLPVVNNIANKSTTELQYLKKQISDLSNQLKRMSKRK